MTHWNGNRQTIRLHRVMPWIVFGLILWASDVAWGCPNCREAVANEASDAGRQASGFAWSILFMMAMPFTLLSAGVAMLARAVRRGTMPEL